MMGNLTPTDSRITLFLDGHSRINDLMTLDHFDYHGFTPFTAVESLHISICFKV